MPRSDDSVLRLDGTSVVIACQVCHFDIAGEAGFLWVDMGDIQKSEEACRLPDDRQNQGSSDDFPEFMALPDPAPWRAHHRQCYPFSKVGAYVIEVERIDTVSRLLWWTCHLINKKWISHTNWDQVLKSASGMEMLC